MKKYRMNVISLILTVVYMIPCIPALTPVCTIYNQTISSSVPGEASLLADVTYSTNNGTPFNEISVVYNISTDTTAPKVVITKNIQVTNNDKNNPEVKISTTLHHTIDSTFSYIKDVSFNDDLTAGLWAELGDGFKPGILEPGVSNTGRNQISWNVASNITVNDSRTFEYLAVPRGEDMKGLPAGKSSYASFVQFSDSASMIYSTVKPTVCVTRTTILQTSLFYQHGFTALSFFMAFLLGIILVILLVFCIVTIMKKKGLMATSISPSKLDQRKLKETGKKIILDPKDAMKKGFNSIKDYSLIGPDDSIVHVLGLKDKLQMFREIDNLDIVTTIHVDTDIEKEQNDAATQTGLMLIHNMRLNNDINKQTEDEVVNRFNSNLKTLDKKLDDDYRKEMEVILIKLCARNKEKVGEMLYRHNMEKEEVEENAADLTEKEKKDFMDILDKQHQTEQNELTYILALEQNEEAEKLRKEFGIRKRMGIREIQQTMINDVTEKGRLTQEQADWLIKEHKKQQDALQLLFDEEISRQRMTLEEKLARRRALAQASEMQEDDQRDLLNTMAGHQVGVINKLKKQNKLTDEEAEDMIEEVKKDMLNAKEKMDKEKERQEHELHKKLSILKQEKMNAIRKKQEGELNEYEKKCKDQQTNGPIEPISVVEGLLSLRSNHRAELLFAEIELDNDHSKQLEKARDLIGERAKDDLYGMEKALLEKLKSQGLKDDVNKIIKQHEREVAELCESQEEQRRRQQEKLMEELSRRKKEWNQRKMSEKKEQEELREHESKVIGKLINSQFSISEEDRLKIMKEHEQNMIKLENTLTLNKLRQKRMLEERLALRRAQQMDKLRQKQVYEVQKQRQKAINNGEDDDDETHNKEIELMKKHAEQRLSILNGQMLNIDEELDEIRIEMVRERAIALKSQEERLGTMIARLQLDKAKELAKIEEQQKAINNLKLNLVDDLNDRGILSTPECEKLLEGHRKQKEELVRKLDENRAKQERALKKRLGERVQLREETMIKLQDKAMQNMTTLSGSKMAAKLKRMMLMHKQLLDLERFRNQMDREISQTLEETRRQYQIQKSETIQNQEMDFIAKLVKFGQLQKEELLDVIGILFPRKSMEEKQQLLNKLYDENQISKISPQQEELLKSSGPSTLPDRVRRMSVSSSELERVPSRAKSRKGGDKFTKQKKKKNLRRESNYSLLDSLGPETLGSINQSDYRRLHDADNGYVKSGRNSSTRVQEDSLHGSYNDGYDSDSYNTNNQPQQFNNSYSNKYRGSSDDLRSSGYDNYGRNYDDDDDYRSTGPVGRLPPLQPIQASPTRSSKKKKKKLLQKMAHRDEYD